MTGPRKSTEPGPRPDGPDRLDQLAAHLDEVRGRIAAAAIRSGRRPEDVTLVAVTKTFPASDVRLLAGLGVRDIGESRDQEAREKAAECADLDLTWHFVGQLQTNKVRSVVRYASVVQSVDRLALVRALDRAATDLDRPLRCLVQVCLDDQPGRGGAAPEDVPTLADAVASASSLELAGLMAIAPLGAEPGPAFARLAETADRLRSRHPGATWLSAGMSEDLEVAISHGATHVRVGRGLLGVRASSR